MCQWGPWPCENRKMQICSVASIYCQVSDGSHTARDRLDTAEFGGRSVKNDFLFTSNDNSDELHSFPGFLVHLQDEVLAPWADEFHEQVKAASVMCYQTLQIGKPIKLIRIII